MAGLFPDALKAGEFASLSGFGAATPPPATVPPRRQEKIFNIGGKQPYLMVNGVFDVNTNAVSELDVQLLGTDPPANASHVKMGEEQRDEFSDGPFLDVVQLTYGTVIDIHSFQVEELDGLKGVFSFLEVIPMKAGVTGIQIRRDGSVLAEKLASSYAPSIQILSPTNGGTLLPGTELSWASEDPDGDPMTYDVFYSADSGKTWRLLTMGLTARSYKLPARLPGSTSARLRVTAHDGFWTTSADTANSFTVPDSPPRAIILHPNGSVVGLGSTVYLSGIGTDLEQGPITDPERFTWVSDRDGVLGNGQEISLRTLSKGVHRITLKVSDDTGNLGSAAILLYVGVDPTQSVWTKWLNVDLPSGAGDYELLSYFLQQGLACTQPLAIDCRTTTGKDWVEAGQVYTCSAPIGGYCVNARQPYGKTCEDYEVRFLCPAPSTLPALPTPAQ
jgi:hypothetical protein